MVHACSSSIRVLLKYFSNICYKDFSNICDWFVDNKLSVHFGENKIKSILCSSRRNLKLVEELDIRYKELKIKQHKHVNYLGCYMKMIR